MARAGNHDQPAIGNSGNEFPVGGRSYQRILPGLKKEHGNLYLLGLRKAHCEAPRIDGFPSPVIAGTGGSAFGRISADFPIIGKANRGAGAAFGKGLFGIESGLCEQPFFPMPEENLKIAQSPGSPGRASAQLQTQHGRVEHGAGKVLRILFQLERPDAAAHGMGIEKQWFFGGSGLYHFLDEMVEIPDIAGEEVDMHHGGIVHFPDGFSVTPVIQNCHLISLAVKVVDQFVIFEAGFAKPVGDGDGSLRIGIGV